MEGIKELLEEIRDLLKELVEHSKNSEIKMDKLLTASKGMLEKFER